MTTVTTKNKIALGVLAAFAAIYIIWGTTYLAIALAIRTVPPFISGAGRFVLAAAVMYACCAGAIPNHLPG